MSRRRKEITRHHLTAFEERFCHEYLVDLNAQQAAIRAGSKAKKPKEIGRKLLRNPLVQARIQQLMEERSKRTQIEADSVLQELAKIGFANMLDYIEVQEDGTAYVNLSRLTRDQAAAIQEVTVDVIEDGSGDDRVPVKRIKFKLADKIRPLELLGKHLGLFPTTVKGTLHHIHTYEDALREVMEGDEHGAEPMDEFQPDFEPGEDSE